MGDNKRILTVLGLAAAAALLAWGLHLTNPMRSLENRSIDWRFLLRGPQAVKADSIVLVLVEEEARLPYRSPIPRRHLAAVIEALGAARVVGLDILLDQPSFDAAGDSLLRRALARHGRVVAVSYLEDGEEHLPDPFFGEVLLDRGYATFPNAGAQMEVVRYSSLAWRLDREIALSFSGALYAHWMGADTQRLRLGHEALGAGATPFLINFSGPPNKVYRQGEVDLDGFVVCPSHVVARGIYPPEVFRDKIVLVGTGLLDAPDMFRTPFFARRYGRQQMYGVEVHAHALQTILSGDYLASWPAAAKAGLTLALALVSVVVARGVGVYRSFGIHCLLFGGLWFGGFALFNCCGKVLPLVLPTLAMMLAYGLSTASYALTEGRSKQQTRRLFEKYLSPEVIEEFIEDPDLWKLGGTRREITVMFADFEGFTPLSEQLSPEDLVALINQNLNAMTEVILFHGGTIDKYEGDLVMAFWGAPMPQADHAIRACRAARDMQGRMEQMRRQRLGEGLPDLRLRIGVHSGPAVVGNMGSDFRFNYTAMGDTVNLAARLEGANKEFGTYILISEATYKTASSCGLEFKRLGSIKVKGKSVPTQVYTLSEAADAASTSA